MEELMVKAIRQFRKEHKNSEIRSCSAWEAEGNFGKKVKACFHIEYIDEAIGEYQNCWITVSK